MTLSTITIWLASLWINGLQAPLLQQLLQLSVQLQSLNRSLQIYDAQGSLFSRSEYSNSQGYRRETELNTTKFGEVLRGNGETCQTPSKLVRSLRVQESAPNSQKLMEINSFCGLIGLMVTSLLKNRFPSSICVKNILFNCYQSADHTFKKYIANKILLNLQTMSKHEPIEASIEEKQPGAGGLKTSSLYHTMSVATLEMYCISQQVKDDGGCQKALCLFELTKNDIVCAYNNQVSHTRALSIPGSMNIQQIFFRIRTRHSFDEFLLHITKMPNYTSEHLFAMFSQIKRNFLDQFWRQLDIVIRYFILSWPLPVATPIRSPIFGYSGVKASFNQLWSLFFAHLLGSLTENSERIAKHCQWLERASYSQYYAASFRRLTNSRIKTYRSRSKRTFLPFENNQQTRALSDSHTALPSDWLLRHRIVYGMNASADS